jgi:hypothetical protein
LSLLYPTPLLADFSMFSFIANSILCWPRTSIYQLTYTCRFGLSAASLPLPTGWYMSLKFLMATILLIAVRRHSLHLCLHPNAQQKITADSPTPHLPLQLSALVISHVYFLCCIA